MSSSAVVATSTAAEPRKRRSVHKATPVTCTMDEDTKDIRDLDLFRLLTPFMMYTQVMGSFFVADANGDDGVSRIRFPRNFWKAYHFGAIVTMCGLSGYVTVIMDTYLRSEHYEFVTAFMGIFLAVMVVENIIFSCLFYYHCSLDAFGKLFRSYWWLAESEEDRRRLSRFVRNTTYVITTMTAGFLVFAVSGWVVINYRGLEGASNSKFTGSALIRFYPSPKLEIIFYTYTYLAYHIMLPWTAWAAFFFIMCLTIWYSLEMFSDQLLESSKKLNDESLMSSSTAAAATTAAFIAEVENYRDRYRRIVNFVQAFDDVAGGYVLVFFMFSITQFACIVYFMLFFCSDGVDKIVQSLWAIGGSSFIVVLTAVGAMVNVATKRCFVCLQYADRWHTDTRGLLKISRFCKDASGPDVALSAMGFFTLTREFAAGLIGTCSSMFFLLLSLSPPSEVCDIHDNSTVKG